MSAAEVWRQIPGYEGYYSASSLGRIRAERRTVEGKLNSIRTLPQKLMTPCLDGGGYLHIRLSKLRTFKTFKVHRLVAMAFMGLPPPGLQVAHNDGVRTNNAAANLRYDTRIGNAADRAKHGTNRTGNKNPLTKLKPEQVLAIRNDPRGLRAIGREYGVHHKSISSIKSGDSWAWL